MTFSSCTLGKYVTFYCTRMPVINRWSVDNRGYHIRTLYVHMYEHSTCVYPASAMRGPNRRRVESIGATAHGAQPLGI